MLPTFALLALSICAVWAPEFRHRDTRVQPWTLLLAAALASGLAYGVLSPTAIIALVLLTVFCVLAVHGANASIRALFMAMAGLLTAALALHLVHGFNNPRVIDGVRLSDGAPPFIQHANFDKGAAGLLLVALLCRRCTSLRDWRDIAGPTLLAIGGTTVVVMSTAVLTGYVRFDPKLPSSAPAFLAINLLFTCVAEEALFRGLIQEQLMGALPRLHWAAVAISALLFGIAHFAGGVANVVLASIAGLGYALAYAATRRIEAPVLAHFAVNLIHFVGFTYPRLT